MGHTQRRIIGLIAAGLLIACAGCGDKPGGVVSSTAEGTVSGTVTFQGKPVTKGEVVFDPSNYQRKTAAARTATIDKDGHYTITTLIGQNKIRVQSPELNTRQAGPMAAYQVLTFDVKKGDNNFDVALPLQQSK